VLRQKWGSVVCPGCKNLVGVQDERCLNCGRWNPGLWGFAPLLNKFGRDLGFTQFVMWSCIALYVVTLLIGGIGRGGGFLNFLSPTAQALFIFGASGGTPVFGYGRWWTVLTAGWLHGGILHILMNMMSLRNVAPIVGEFYGPSRMTIIYIVSGIAGFTASSVFSLLRVPFLGGNFTVGASAGLMGLIGALIYYGRRTGSRAIADQAKQSVIMMVVIGFIVPVIDNGAHLGGLAGGYLCSKILDPLYPERLDHLMIALALLGITAIAVILSVVSALRLV
jgi:rhomboid protease GluP